MDQCLGSGSTPLLPPVNQRFDATASELMVPNLDVVVCPLYAFRRARALSTRQGIGPSFSARSSSNFTEEGCQLVLPWGVRSRIALSLLQTA